MVLGSRSGCQCCGAARLSTGRRSPCFTTALAVSSVPVCTPSALSVFVFTHWTYLRKEAPAFFIHMK